ncbi:uncharacterized protein HaLaN_08290, partial [Haematococcus lacustris]
GARAGWLVHHRERLGSEGLALFQLTAAADSQLFQDSVVKMYVPGRPLPYHQLGQGDVILISRDLGPRHSRSPIDDDSAYEAVLLDYSSRWLRVAVPAAVGPILRGPGWRLDLYANTVAYERSLEAVEGFARGPGSIQGGGRAQP